MKKGAGNLSVTVRHQLSSTMTEVEVKNLADGDDDVNVETKQEMLDMDDMDDMDDEVL